VPESLIRSGDPYRMQVETTVRLVMEAGAWNNPHSLCWQSRVGPGKWLQPSLHDELHRLATAGTRSLFVVPISFVTDHIETLYEIDIESREEAAALGIDRFAMMPALNSDPTFIACLDDLVRRTLDAGATADGTCRTLSPGGGHRLCPLWDAVSAGGTGPARSAVSGWK
jgi:ferrochelatase